MNTEARIMPGGYVALAGTSAALALLRALERAEQQILSAAEAAKNGSDRDTGRPAA